MPSKRQSTDLLRTSAHNANLHCWMRIRGCKIYMYIYAARVEFLCLWMWSLSSMWGNGHDIIADFKSFKVNGQNSWRTALLETLFTWALEYEFLHNTNINLNAYLSRSMCDIRYDQVSQPAPKATTLTPWKWQFHFYIKMVNSETQHYLLGLCRRYH